MKTTTRCAVCGGGTGQAGPCICVILYSEGDLRFAVATAKTEIERLTAERDEYQRAADKMAMEHKVERDGLSMQIDALAKYRLPDSLYPDSKDWLAGDYAARVEWLHTGYEAKKAEIESLLQQVEFAHGEMFEFYAPPTDATKEQ